MSRVRVDEFLIDEDNQEKFDLHDLSCEQVVEVLEHPFAVVRNKRGLRGVYKIIGTDNGGLCITIPIEPTYKAGLWRPATAWPCKTGEQTVLNNAKGSKRL